MNRRARLLRTVVIASLLLTLAASLVPNRPASAQTLRVLDNAAAPRFPDGIDFSLEAETDVAIERVELRYSLAGDQTVFAAFPTFSDSNAIAVSYTADMRSLLIPPGIDVTYHWRLVGDDGSVVETEPSMAPWVDDRFEWTKLADGQVEVYAYSGDNDFTQQILDSALRTVDRLQPEFGLQSIEPIRIWAYNSQDDFAAAQVVNSEGWSAAIAFPELGLVNAVLRPGNSSEVGRIVPHEISHQLLHQATKNPFNHVPAWLDEGLAVLNQEHGGENLPAIVTSAAEEGRLYSIRALNSSFPYDPDDVSLAYAESLSIVTFIIDHYGTEKLSELIAAYRDGLSHDEAAMQALGVDLDGLDEVWKASVGYRVGTDSASSIVVVDSRGLTAKVLLGSLWE